MYTEKEQISPNFSSSTNQRFERRDGRSERRCIGFLEDIALNSQTSTILSKNQTYQRVTKWGRSTFYPGLYLIKTSAWLKGTVLFLLLLLTDRLGWAVLASLVWISSSRCKCVQSLWGVKIIWEAQVKAQGGQRWRHTQHGGSHLLQDVCQKKRLGRI